MAYETRDSPTISLDYVRKAIPLLTQDLESANDQGKKMQTLYLLSEYSRRLGNSADSMRYFEKLKSTDPKDGLTGFKDYLLNTAAEQRNPDSSLDHPNPEKPQAKP